MEGTPFYAGKNLNIINTLYELHYIESAPDKLLVLQIVNLRDVYAKKELNRKK